MLFIYNVIALMIWLGGYGPEGVAKLNDMITGLSMPGFLWYLAGLVVMAVIEKIVIND